MMGGPVAPRFVLFSSFVNTVSPAAAIAAFVGVLFFPTIAQASLAHGELERSAIDAALQELGRVEENDPIGREVCEVYVRAFPIFLEEDVLPTWLNAFHRVTRERVIRRENTLRPGTVVTQSGLEDAERAIRDGSVFSVAVVVPIEASSAECVDLLLVTRDVWSLRVNGSVETNGETISSLYFGVSESNLFGTGDTLALGFERSVGAWRMGPTYLSQHLAGSRVTLYESFSLILDRESGGLDGTANSFQLARPLYASDVRWAWSVSADHSVSTQRRYTGSQLDHYELDGYEVPERFRSRSAGASAGVTRSWGDTLKIQLSPSVRVAWNDYAPDPRDSSIPQEILDRYRALRLPRSALDVGPGLGFSMFENRYFRLVNYQTYGTSEELREGHALELSARQSEPLLGADERSVTLGTVLTYRLRLGDDAFAAIGFQHGMRVAASGVTDAQVTASARLVSARRFAGRLVARAVVTEQRRNESNTVLGVGGDNGLRGFANGFLKGTNALQANVEWRSLSFRIASARIGGVASFDVGSVWEARETPTYYSSVGVGLRVVIPLMGTEVRAIDVSLPLQGPRRPVLSVRVGQAF